MLRRRLLVAALYVADVHDGIGRSCGMRHPVHRSIACARYERVIIVVLRVLITVHAMSTPGRHRRDTSFRMPSSVSVARRPSLRRVIFSSLVHVRVSLGDGSTIRGTGSVSLAVLSKRMQSINGKICDAWARNRAISTAASIKISAAG